jgi:uncharacterized Rmd1/YagE family protein
LESLLNPYFDIRQRLTIMNKEQEWLSKIFNVLKRECSCQ